MRLEFGTVDPRVRRYLPPVQVVWQDKVLGAGSLLNDGSVPCLMKYGDAPPVIVLDFGREIHGGIQITNSMTPAHAPTPVRVRFGESIAEAMGTPNQDHAIHDQVIQVPWYGYAEFGNTGFRYVRIELVEPGTQLDVTRIRAVFLYRDLEYKGAFHSSDELLNRIWDTGAYTVHLCMQDMLWDGIKRDRLVWIGDMHPETMTVNTVFGEVDVVPRSLDYVRDCTPLPGWMNGIGSYSLWWIRIHRTWYLYHGNRDYLETQRTYLKGLLELLLTQIDANNSEHLGGARFLDWPSSQDESAVHTGLHALLIMGLRDGAALCEVLGETGLRDTCLNAIKKLLTYTPPPTAAKQANALCALAGLTDPEKTNREVLAKDPLHGISTFYGYYVLQARAAAQDYEGGLEVIRRFWGRMLELGATTFWEDFNLAWAEDGLGIDQIVPQGKKSIHTDYGDFCYKGLRHSLCHGWASGPTAWLTEHVLGIRPLEAGCTKLLVAPNLGGLDFAEGAFPTPKGLVHVTHRRSPSGEVKTDIEAPAGISTVNKAGTMP